MSYADQMKISSVVLPSFSSWQRYWISRCLAAITHWQYSRWLKLAWSLMATKR